MKIGPFLLTPCALVLDRETSLEEWEGPVRSLEAMQRSINWWLGDAVVRGEELFGDDVFQVFSDGVSVDLLTRCATVSREFPMAERNLALSWTHHFAVCGLPKPLQRALLSKAAVNNWGSGEFREHLAKLKRVSKEGGASA